MLVGGSFELAQARVHARLAGRPGASAWTRLEAIRDPGAFLEAAAAVVPGFAALGISARTPVHAIEQRLIDRWRALAGEVGSWLPTPWRRPVEWLATLARWPALVHLVRGREWRDWMDDDADLRPLLHRAPPDGEIHRVRVGWYLHWRRLLPTVHGEHARSLQAIERVVGDHLARYADATPKDAWLTRRQLDAALVSCLRRHPLTPVPALAYVALSGLDVERLRAELLGRIVFGARPQ